MQLKDLKDQWSELNRRTKLEIVESSNERRLEAFERAKNKKRRTKKKKSSSSKKSKKKTPTTAEGLVNLVKDMTPEERENFNLFIQTQKNK